MMSWIIVLFLLLMPIQNAFVQLASLIQYDKNVHLVNMVDF